MTWKQAYSNYNLAYAMTHRRNHQLDKQLKATDLDKKIKVWNQPKYNHKFTNEALIRLLAITSDEVETLKIGYNKKLKAERAQRNVYFFFPRGNSLQRVNPNMSKPPIICGIVIPSFNQITLTKTATSGSI